MNVYDFDKTIYRDDSTVDFWLYCLRRKPSLVRFLPAQAVYGLKFVLGRMEKTAFKEHFYRFLTGTGDTERLVADFWDGHFNKINDWYIEARRGDDVIISASPEFLLRPACDRLGVKSLIASRVDMKSGKYEGINCHGREKVNRFFAEFPDGKVDSFYSDSRSDTPMASLAAESYLVRGEHLENWD